MWRALLLLLVGPPWAPWALALAAPADAAKAWSPPVANHGQKGPVLLARPRRPARGQYYPVQDMLDCTGSNFSHSRVNWDDWYEQVMSYFEAGLPNDEDHMDVVLRAAQIIEDLQDDLMPTSMKYPQVLVRQISVSRLNGFCLYGYAAALYIYFRHTLEPNQILGLEQSMGWVEWPLDFMESSRWPTLWRMVPLHLEEYRRRGNMQWTRSIKPSEWGDDAKLLERPDLREVQQGIQTYLDDVGAVKPIWQTDGMSERGTQSLLTRSLEKRRRLSILVLGHHLGSSMEPFSMLREALRVDPELQVDASFFGQRHPKPGLVCLEFGYCEQNKGVEEWFKRYEQRWLGEYDWMPDRWDEALQALADVVHTSDFRSKADVVVCGGPAWFCAMLRAFWSVPMLLYFAWPITPLIPAGFKNHVFTQIKFLGQSVHPAAVIVAANWVLAAQFAVQAQMHVPVLRPHGIYVNQTYAPIAAPNGNPRVMVTRLGQWARISGVALLEVVWSLMDQDKREKGRPFPLDLVFLSIRIRGVDTNAPLTYADFASYHACIFWPWDVMMLLFNELYTITVPLLVPDSRWMSHLIVHAVRHTEVNWWHIRSAVGGALPSASPDVQFPLPHLPWLEDSGGLREAAYWYETTDFVQFPHITYFHSLPDMLEKVRNLDVPAIRKGMRRFNTVTLRRSVDWYRRAAVELLRK